MKNIAVSLFTFCLLMAFAGCEQKKELRNRITGKWVVTDVTGTDTTRKDTAGVMVLVMAMSGVDHLEFTEEGQVRSIDKTGKVLHESGYELAGDGKSIYINQETGRLELKITELTDKTMVIQDENARTFFTRK